MNTTQQALPPTSKAALREEIKRLRAQLDEYVGHEPTIREEMQHLSSENDTLRKAVVFLMIETAGKTSVDLWNDDLDHWAGSLDFEPSPDRKNATRFTFTPSAGRTRDGVTAAAATATVTTMRELLAAHIAAALTSSNRSRWKAGRDLAQGLDAVGANVDRLVEPHVPKEAWSGPAVPPDDPWTPTPDVTDDVPEVVRRVIAGRLADMLLAPNADELHQWARNLAYGLKSEGADLTGDIKDRIHALTLGADPAEPPF